MFSCLFKQVPVACKACPCGHSFFNARRNSIKSPPSPDSGTMKTRRTNRIKREKPNYYDALEYDKQTRKSAKVSELIVKLLSDLYNIFFLTLGYPKLYFLIKSKKSSYLMNIRSGELFVKFELC